MKLYESIKRPDNYDKFKEPFKKGDLITIQEKEETKEDLKQFLEDWDTEDYVYKSIKLIYDKLKGDKE